MGLARDVNALRMGRVDAVEMHGVECAQCPKPATHTCRGCTPLVHLCAEHAGSHFVDHQHLLVPFAAPQAAAAAAADVALTCSKHPGQ